MNKPPQDYGIPMLTEVLDTPTHGADGMTDIPELTQLVESPSKAETNIEDTAVTDFALNLSPNRVSPSVQHASATGSEDEARKVTANAPPEQNMIDDVLAPSSTILNQAQDEEWALLQDQITERVLAQIMRRIDSQLELRVRDNLADVLQLAIHKLSEEIRAGLQHTLEDVINDAVKHEITKVKFSKE